MYFVARMLPGFLVGVVDGGGLTGLLRDVVQLVR